MKELTAEEKSAFLKNQQGELDAVLMYQRLAKVARTDREREAFTSLAKDEGRHASVFFSHTRTVLKAKKTKAWLVSCLYRLLPKEKLFPKIAAGEYAAEKRYEPLIAAFPDLESVKADEKRHGDTVLGLLTD